METVVNEATECGGGLATMVYGTTFETGRVSGPKGPAVVSTVVMGELRVDPGVVSGAPRAVGFPIGDFLGRVNAIEVFFGISSIYSQRVVCPTVELVRVKGVVSVLFLVAYSME